MDPFKLHLKELPIYKEIKVEQQQAEVFEEVIQIQSKDDETRATPEHEESSEQFSYADKIQEFVEKFPGGDSLKFNTIIPEVEIILSQAVKKAIGIYDNLMILAKEHGQSSEVFEIGKKVFLEQITLESLTNNIITNSIMSYTQKSQHFPDTLYVRIFVTLTILLILTSTSFKLLFFAVLVAIPLCLNTLKIIIISMIVKALCYILFSKKKKETSYVQETINLFEQQSTTSFVYVPIFLSIILLITMKFDLLEGPLVWGGLTLIIATIFICQQALVREKSPTNLWMVVAPVILLVISMLLISFRGNGLAYLWSYTENINLQNRADIVRRKGEINYMKQAISLNSQYSDLIDDYGEVHITLERGYKYMPKQQRQQTASKPKEPDKHHQLGILWFNEDNWTSTFFSMMVPLALFILHFFIHAQNDIGQDVVVASVIAAQKDSSNKDSQPPAYSDKIASYIVATRFIPPPYLLAIIINMVLALYPVTDWKHSIFLIVTYGLAVILTAWLFSVVSTMSWTSVATNIRGGTTQISRDYFFGNIISGLASNHIKQVVVGSSITLSIIVAAALHTNEYHSMTILSIIAPAIFCALRYYLAPNDTNYQTYLMISIAILVQCYLAAAVLILGHVYLQHSIIFYTYNIKGKRNAIFGQPEALTI